MVWTILDILSVDFIVPVENETFASWRICPARLAGAWFELRAGSGADTKDFRTAKHSKAISRADSQRPQIRRHGAEPARRGRRLSSGQATRANLIGLGSATCRGCAGPRELRQRTVLRKVFLSGRIALRDPRRDEGNPRSGGQGSRKSHSGRIVRTIASVASGTTEPTGLRDLDENLICRVSGNWYLIGNESNCNR